MTAVLSFCNDIDFASWPVYREVHHVLENEFGIRAGDSFWMFDPAGSDMALFKGSLKEKGPYHDELLQEIRDGRLDVMHSGGNFSLTNTDQRPSRELLAEGLAYLAEHAKVPRIWTNHGDHGDIANVGGAQPVYQQGDHPGSPAYVLDLLQAYGVRYFWLDHHCSNQFVFTPRAGKPQSVLSRETTRAGLPITCFRRYRGALPKAPTALTLHLQLTDENLEALVQHQGVCVVYQHWCAHRDGETGPAICARSPVFPPEALTQLKRLSDYQARNQIRIRPLGELLDACQV